MADIYVDADIAGDSGAGTTGDPYGDLQWALNARTLGATGDTFWLNGTEILTGKLSYVSYGAPAFNKPCTIRGWNGADATTDGTGGIDGNAGNFTICDQGQGCIFHNLELTNTGTAVIISGFIGYCSGVSNCVVHNSSGNGIEGDSNAAFAVNNHIHDVGGIGISKIGMCLYNYMENGTKTFTAAIDPDDRYPCVIAYNIISVTGATNGIVAYIQGVIQHNSLLMTSRTGSPIGLDNTQSDGNSVLNNVVEGFTTGISCDEVMPLYGGNHCYNNTTNYSVTGPLPVNFTDNEDLSGSTPFAKSGSDTFANRFTYFAPAVPAIGNMHGGAWPVGCLLDKGAVQHADPAGALSFIHTRRNTLIGR